MHFKDAVNWYDWIIFNQPNKWWNNTHQKFPDPKLLVLSDRKYTIKPV